MRKYLATLSVASAALLTPAAASAAVITYDVTDVATNAAGLFTINEFMDEFGTANWWEDIWSWQDGATFTLDTDTGSGSLSGTVRHWNGETADIDMQFGGYLDSLDGTDYKYVVNRGEAYNPAEQDFYTDASGSFTFGSFGTYTIDPSDPLSSNSVFQLGNGANAWDPSFGFATWINVLDPTGQRIIGHWDVVGRLTERPTDVPEPAPIALLALGLGGIAFSRARRRKKAIAAV